MNNIQKWLYFREFVMSSIVLIIQNSSKQSWFWIPQFFWGQLSQDWASAIELYYNECKPGPAYTPDQWIHTTINATWNFSMSLWQQWCASYHGVNSLHTLEHKWKSTAQWAKDVYQQTIGTVTPIKAIILHRHKVTKILNWTKQPLDAYLATAKVICEWNVEPG